MGALLGDLRVKTQFGQGTELKPHLTDAFAALTLLGLGAGAGPYRCPSKGDSQGWGGGGIGGATEAASRGPFLDLVRSALLAFTSTLLLKARLGWQLFHFHVSRGQTSGLSDR